MIPEAGKTHKLLVALLYKVLKNNYLANELKKVHDTFYKKNTNINCSL